MAPKSNFSIGIVGWEFRLPFNANWVFTHTCLMAERESGFFLRLFRSLTRKPKYIRRSEMFVPVCPVSVCICVRKRELHIAQRKKFIRIENKNGKNKPKSRFCVLEICLESMQQIVLNKYEFWASFEWELE